MLRVALRKTSLVDYPGRVAAVVFFPGCNLRCPWCHNSPLVEPRPAGEREKPGESDLVDLGSALELIERRRFLIGGVVFSGGEPLLRRELGDSIRRVREAGLRVKLDTNGTSPAALESLLSDGSTRPDYVALDLKLAPRRYGELFPVGGLGSAAAVGETGRELGRSAALLAASGAEHEFRSLAFGSGFFAASDIEALAPLVDGSPWYFSPFRPGGCLDPLWDSAPAGSPEDAGRLAAFARSLGKDARVRGEPG
ncbi:MAG: anaerobic ribonucleoside-triphosphate reductase activating protein [Treponema sp. GWB1_62_6]|nr:MAG: anaerobic ribonucleoside-triphosphate reductase activating protein [Treponema sp. GWA1_62_8]OHE63598.1 MAG: anaerobic ribonucleoside-triphosphate reductase activating protein [Treponema sp. GWB1_62_6]OHE63837.1 MAG: anaerobic ribonucleoside-triphosphate reductase activating protein [Treponema sp. GWC1_61_84]HCM27917.1 anaerobic ribonucleoside-triphosphate reductase activating protein [Treponema sp.]